jgi:hypothetical protein
MYFCSCVVQFSPEASFLPNELYRIDLLVVPVWGLYANMLAQILSQVTSHFIIYYHRRVIKEFHRINNQVQSDDDIEKSVDKALTSSFVDDAHNRDDQAETLSSHVYKRPHRGVDDGIKVKPCSSLFVTGLCVGAIGLIILGCVLPSYSFDVQGLVGIAKEAGQNFAQAKDDHSILSLASLLVDEGRLLGTIKDKIGMGFIATLLILSTLIVPCLEAIGYYLQWTCALVPTQRRQVQYLLEILSAWSYIEVYLLSIIVGAWQIGGVSSVSSVYHVASVQLMFTLILKYLTHILTLITSLLHSFHMTGTCGLVLWSIREHIYQSCVLWHFI